MKLILIKNLILIAVLSLCCGCTLGPQFKSPQAPDLKSLSTSKKVKNSVGQSQSFVYGQDVQARWWENFKSPKLNQVIEIAIKANPNLTSLKETLHQVQEEVNVKRAELRSPNVYGTLNVAEQRETTINLGNKKAKAVRYDVENLALNASYGLDLFGQNKRELESVLAKMDYQKFQMEAAYLNLTTGIVASVGKEMALREQIKVTQEIIDTLQKQLDLFEKQFALGGASKLDILTQRTLIEQTKANLPAMQKELSYTRHQLAVYLGKFPQEEASLPEFHLEEITLPMDLPVSLPSTFVRQRPDIRASEELLHVASANIGVAQADLYPNFTLTGSYGTEANKIADLFRSERLIGNITAGIMQPIFDGGALRAKYRSSWNAYNQALAEYRQTVLSAFQNVADVLQAIESDVDLVKAQMDSMMTAKESFELAKSQFDSGAASFLQLLNAQKDFSQSRIGFVQAQATRFADTTALYQALGGGWWNRKEDNL